MQIFLLCSSFFYVYQLIFYLWNKTDFQKKKQKTTPPTTPPHKNAAVCFDLKN